jgi:hypothetical protein
MTIGLAWKRNHTHYRGQLTVHVQNYSSNILLLCLAANAHTKIT